MHWIGYVMLSTRCTRSRVPARKRYLLRLLSGVVGAVLTLGGAALSEAFAQAPHSAMVFAAATQSAPSTADQVEKEPTPEERMNRRFPQPARVGDLIGLPVLDWRDRTIGYVSQIVRTPAGKIQLIVPYNAWFGWMHLNWGRRPVAVPLETVAILGRQIAALDMPRKDFDAAPTFEAAQAMPLHPDEMIRIAITRR